MNIRLTLTCAVTLLAACTPATAPNPSVSIAPSILTPAATIENSRPLVGNVAQAAATVPPATAAPSPSSIPTWAPTEEELREAKRLQTVSVAALVEEITNAKSLIGAQRATEEALARGGVATGDPNRVYINAIEPKASLTLLPQQTANLAAEARDRSTTASITVSRLGEMLAELGWEFRKDSAPGEQLVQFFSVWVKGAQQAPGDPYSFTPLFLAEMAKRQAPPVNLVEGAVAPEQYRLSLLEVLLFTAAFDRAAKKVASNDVERYPAQLAYLVHPGSHLAGANMTQTEYCTKFKQSLVGFLGQLEGSILSEAFEKALESTIEDAQGAEKSKLFMNGYAAIKIITKAINLIAYYRSVNLAVGILDENTVHKPNEHDLPLIKQFTARAQVDRVDDDRQKLVHDEIANCFKLLGMPTLDQYEDLAGQVDSWSVEWEIVSGDPEHAQINYDASAFKFPGQRQHQLRRTGQAAAEAVLFVDIMREKEADHPGAEHSGIVVVKAELESSQMIGLDTLWDAGWSMMNPLDVANAVMDPLSGFIREMAQPTAYATLTVTYHARSEFLIEGTARMTYTGAAIPGLMYETGTVNGDFSIKARIVGELQLDGNGTGKVTWELEQAIDPEAKEKGIPSPFNCTKKFTGNLQYLVAGEVNANNELDVMITTPLDGPRASDCQYEGSVRSVNLTGRFTIPLEERSYHFVIQEERITETLDNYLIYCGIWEGNCTLTTVWDFKVRLLGPATR